MAIYMKYGRIDGQVTTDAFAKWIELESFQWGVQRATKLPSGGMSKRESSNPQISEITVTKLFDKSSVGIIQQAVAGAYDPKAQIVWTTTTKTKVETYLTVELESCAITSFETDSNGRSDSGPPRETLKLNFSRIMWRTSLLNSKGQQEISGTFGYDLMAMAIM
jgi:type VI secretion system secreted protein Hcp